MSAVVPEQIVGELVEQIVRRLQDGLPPAPILVDVEQAQKMLSMGDTNFKELYRSGEIPIVRNGRKPLFLVEDLRQWAMSHRQTYSPL